MNDLCLQFPPPFAEWNDRFRDTVRTFWLPDVLRSARREPGHGVRGLATRLAGSQDLFGTRDRGPIASINYVAAHDGFTLADTTAFEHKHNGANGEGNRDGSDDNRSWNHGLEGPPDLTRPTGVAAAPGAQMPDANTALMAARRRSIRNLMATEMLATGVPMINAGDEFGRTQRGNNNAYCQDNETSWFDWDLEPWQVDLLSTTRFLTRLRASTPVLRQRFFFSGRPAQLEGLADLQWFAADGQPMRDDGWHDPHTRTLMMFLDGTRVGGQSLLLIFHGAASDAMVTLPARGDGATYRLVWDSAQERPPASNDSGDHRYPDPELMGPDPDRMSPDRMSPLEDGPVTLTAASVRIYRPVP